LLKVLDKLVFKSFIPPYIVAFLIAEFVLVMQFLWKYIDEIIGKGVSAGVILELVFYFAVTIIPLAIPITILISSVMVFGNMSERHELSSFKSGGVSLIRIMAAGIVLSIFTAIFSLIASNYLKPTAYYQYFYRFNSIKKQKSALSIVPGEFNRDFKNFVFLVGEKGPDGKTIKDVVIYDHSEPRSPKLNVVVADDGEMYPSNDGQFFIMKLFNGKQTRENDSNYNKETKERSYPLIETKFEEWTKIFDMSQFAFTAVDYNLDRKKYDLMNTFQLSTEIDSFRATIKLKKSENNLTFDRLLPNLKEKKEEEDDDETEDKAVKDVAVGKNKVKKNSHNSLSISSKKEKIKPNIENPEKSVSGLTEKKGIPNKPQKPRSNQQDKNDISIVSTNISDLKSPEKIKEIKTTINTPIYKEGQKQDVQNEAVYSSKDTNFITDIQDSIPLKTTETLLLRYKDGNQRIIKSAHTAVIRKRDIFLNNSRDINNTQRYLNVYRLRFHQQYSWAMVCILFLFIGAPLGSIIRKGGYGYPLLISILFFMIFIILNILGEKLNKSQSMNPMLAAWLPCIVLSPFAVFLTIKAVNEAKFNSSSSKLMIWLNKIMVRPINN